MAKAMMDQALAFLAQKRIAVVGVSSHEKDFTRGVLREFLRRGLDAVPVNPAVDQVDGRRCYARLQEIRPPVSGALLMTAPSRTEAVVRDCLEAGIRRVWMHRGAGAGSASPEAVALCRANGIDLVTDLCPFMVLPGSGLPHRIHGFFRCLTLR